MSDETPKIPTDDAVPCCASLRVELSVVNESDSQHHCLYLSSRFVGGSGPMKQQSSHGEER